MAEIYFSELTALSHYSFLQSASSPAELVEQAAILGYRALALTDECSYAGIVKAHVAAEQHDIKLIIGSQFYLADVNVKLVLLACNRDGYSEISALISKSRRRSSKGSYTINEQDFRFGTRNCLAILLPFDQQSSDQLKTLAGFFKQRCWLGVCLLQVGDDQRHLQHCKMLSEDLDLPMLACNQVLMHDRSRKPLLDVLSAVRHNTTVQALGHRRIINAERCLRSFSELQKIYPLALLRETEQVVSRCHFSLSQLRYEYPPEVVPAGLSATAYLRDLVMRGANIRWPQSISEKNRRQIEHELSLIYELRYEHYFLTVYDIVRFAKGKNILCQGRGSAANSIVCYCLFITEVDPDQSQLLFERFISKERGEPPDIDVDFEHERREEVIQYIYQKYTRKRAALLATVITYRLRSAVRDAGKALGFDQSFIAYLLKDSTWWEKPDAFILRLQKESFLQPSFILKKFFLLVRQILGFPRHLSQHVGGFLITKSPVSTLVPTENASMEDRTIIQWDKYDVEALGLLKVDVLALGMLSAIRKTFALIAQHEQKNLSMSEIPAGDKETYDMLCVGDSVGVFQVESRAQMSMLPRLRPRCYYDLVIQVAIVRPGPIQGDMVHPYLRRRNGEEAVDYMDATLEPILKRTLGIPIFQEQVIQIAMLAAGFTGGEADELRRAMASWGKNGNLSHFEDKLIQGMLARGYTLEFAQRIFQQMKGFGSYGFPESHSASFAWLAYVSAWLKCHHPAAFYCGLLNSLPMGFYSASQLIQDARRHHIAFQPVDVTHSEWDHRLELNTNGVLGICLGLRQVKGLNAEAGKRIVEARQRQPFRSARDLVIAAQLTQQDVNCLARADALRRLAGHRFRAQWEITTLPSSGGLIEACDAHLADPGLPEPTETQDISLDYQSTHLSLRRHPMSLLREHPAFRRCSCMEVLPNKRHGQFVSVAGLVTGRQRPGSASGVVFLTLEDETGNGNIIVWKQLQQRAYKTLIRAQLLLVKGVVEISHGVAHVIAGELIDRSEDLGALRVSSRDFH